MALEPRSFLADKDWWKYEMTRVSIQVTALTQLRNPQTTVAGEFASRQSGDGIFWREVLGICKAGILRYSISYIYIYIIHHYIIHHYAYIYICIRLHVRHLSWILRPLVGRIHHPTGIRALLESTLRSTRKSHVSFWGSYGGSERPGSNISNLVVYGFKIHSAKPMWITVKYRRPLGFLQLWQVAFTGNAHGLLVVRESQRTGIYGWRWTLGLGRPAASKLWTSEPGPELRSKRKDKDMTLGPAINWNGAISISQHA